MKKKYKGAVIGLNLKTAIVEIKRTEIHPKYKKPVEKKTKVYAHNENFSLKIGDKVLIESSKPYSATKRFIVLEKEQ